MVKLLMGEFSFKEGNTPQEQEATIIKIDAVYDVPSDMATEMGENLLDAFEGYFVPYLYKGKVIYPKQTDMVVGADVCSDLMDADNRQLLKPIFVYDLHTGNKFPVLNVDTTVTDCIDININTEEQRGYYKGFMETYFEVASCIANMPHLDLNQAEKADECYTLAWKFEKKYQNYDFDEGDYYDKIDEMVDEYFTTDQDKRIIATLKAKLDE